MTVLKKIIEKFNDYRYRKRLLKFVTVNLKLIWRKFKRVLCSKKLHAALRSVPAIMTYVSVVIIGLLITSMLFFVKYATPVFSSEQRIMRRLSLEEYDSTVPYLCALDAFGSSNRIQVTLKTDTENYINPRGVGLDRGGVNLILTFEDGNSTEISLNNNNYDNFESGMEDTFTVILPFGYTAFDITDYTIAILPDINNKYDSWHCKWARIYFMLGNESVMLAKETWDDVAVFGGGDTEIRKTNLEIAHTDNARYQRTVSLYSYYLDLAAAGMTEFLNDDLRSDALYSMSLTTGKYLWVDIETVDIEIQNNLLTYYTKGVDIPETDSLDYDGRLFLDITFYTAKKDGTYTESYLLDTLGTDDFELGSTSVFQLEMPEGLCVFDICSMSIRTENPYDSWAPRYIRLYVKPDYADRLEIGRLNDVMLTNSYSTAVFYKNLLEDPVAIDLTSEFAISSVVKKQFEEKHGFTLGEKTEDIYFELMSFYDRQLAFYEKLTELYSATVYDDTVPENEGETVDPVIPDDDTALPDIEEKPEEETDTEETVTDENTDDQAEQDVPVTDDTVQTDPETEPTDETVTEDTETEDSGETVTEDTETDDADSTAVTDDTVDAPVTDAEDDTAVTNETVEEEMPEE